MIYFSDAELDTLLLEDIYRGDLTSRTLGLGKKPGKMLYKRKKAGRIAGMDVAMAMLRKLDLEAQSFAEDGMDVEAGAVLIEVKGDGERLHQAWKVVQVTLEWCCGVAQYMAEMVANARSVNPNAVVACTRKTMPGSRKLATVALIAGGGHIHRAGTSETLLIFANHRHLLDEPENYVDQVKLFRKEAPENKITIEADTLDDVTKIIPSAPDVIQLDKFPVEDVLTAKRMVEESGLPIMLSVAGGVNRNNVAEFAKTGVNLFITSAPYCAGPDDIKVVITAE